MAEHTEIEWTDHSWSPWWGCTKISPGCAHCYAASWAKWTRGIVYAKGEPRVRTKDWSGPRKWQRKRAWEVRDAEACGRDPGPRPKVFPSMMDWLDDEVPIAWLADFLQLIHETPELDWLLLTKRPENWRPRLEEAHEWLIEYDEEARVLRECLAHWLTTAGNNPANIWLGTTVENQECAEKRIPDLLKIPARVRFLSCEPLLGPVDLQFSRTGTAEDRAHFHCAHAPFVLLSRSKEIHWVIAGGESGPRARPMHPDWARSLRDQCQAAGVAFHFKQWGEWCPADQSTTGRYCFVEPTGKVSSPEKDGVVACDGTIDAAMMYRPGKKSAGRLLDGREWNEVPQP